jgi:prephenate dehydratase
MSKPEQFPQDVLVAARKAALTQYSSDMKSYAAVLNGEADTWPIVKVAARAIMAAKAEEREAIAQLAEATADHYDAKSIADAIEDVPANRAAEKALKGFASGIRNPTHPSNMGER